MLSATSPANQPAVKVIDYHGTLGQINYETFCQSMGSSPVAWSKMSQEQQAAWYQGAIAVVETVWREKHHAMATEWEVQNSDEIAKERV